jgi:hypothetical protein
LIVGGQSHSAGQRDIDDTRYSALADFAQRYFGVAEVTHRWSTQDPKAYDALPMVGSYLRGASRLWVATAFAKWSLGCMLRFNGAERSWDCSCHGSRFDVDGAVLEGPATRPLPRRDH